MNCTKVIQFHTKLYLKGIQLLLLCMLAGNAFAQQYTLLSPDKSGEVLVQFENGTIYYSFNKSGVPVVEKSALGIELNEQSLNDLKVIKVKKDSNRSTWTPVWGTQKNYPDHYNGMVLQMQDKKSGSAIAVLVRMYNEGLAFRYEIETKGITAVTLKKERTEFNIPANSKCWMLNHPWGKRYKMDVPVMEVKNASLPLLSHSENGKYVLITEAALYNYGSLHLSANAKGMLQADIVGTVQIEPNFSTPWRVIMAADAPAYFVEHNYIIQNLNAPSKIKNTSWIKPGITTWDWRVRGAIENGFEYQLNTESLIRLIDKTAELDLPYFMLDAGWYGVEHEKASNPLTAIPEIDIQAFMQSAKEKKIGIWLYVNRVAFEEYDIDTLLSTYKKWGVVGIKLGFLKAQNQEGIALLQRVLEKCADYELLFDCHESVIPSGIERTWPHFMTREYNHSLADGGYVASPIDHTITPFLNNVAGPIDVTPGFFDINKMAGRTYIKEAVRSTVVAQAAMSVTYFSPLLCLPDVPEAYQRKLDLFEFIKSLPLSYDETKVLVGEIGKTYIVARRKGNTWWIGGVTNEEATINLPFQFLNKGNYKATIFSDGDTANWKTNSEAYTKTEKKVKPEESLKLKLAAGGGVCIKMELIK